MTSFLKRLTREHGTLLLLSIAFWTPLIIFFKLAGEVVEQEPIATDIMILQWLHAHANSVLDQIFFVITNMGGVLSVAIMTAAIVGFLLYKRKFRSAALVALSVGGAALANLILKALFHRDRPSLFQTQVVETNFSFPSGHAMGTAALMFCLMLLTWPTKWRWPVIIIGGIFVILVGISRLYFGVHYPTDIIAGWCASIGWVMLVFFVVKRISR